MPPDADPLAFLFALNITLAAKERAGEKVTSPGLPLPQSEHNDYITADCVKTTGQ